MINTMKRNALAKRKTIFTRGYGPSSTKEIDPKYLKEASEESIGEILEKAALNKRGARKATMVGILVAIVITYLMYIGADYLVHEAFD